MSRKKREKERREKKVTIFMNVRVLLLCDGGDELVPLAFIVCVFERERQIERERELQIVS